MEIELINAAFALDDELVYIGENIVETSEETSKESEDGPEGDDYPGCWC